jgi:hypothetical protein
VDGVPEAGRGDSDSSLILIGGAMLTGELLAAFLASKRFRSEFSGISGSLEELRADLRRLEETRRDAN